MLNLRNIYFIIILVVIVVGVNAADWPQWRGVNRDGLSKETHLLKEWPKDGPELLWSVNGIGRG
jgi:hypothetical protein